jgi:periplasmic divalent cation tolerance protein
VTVLICLCTCPDQAVAEHLSHTLVGERLAACVTMLPAARSVYRWQGAVEQADEVQLLIKTTDTALDSLVQRIVELHPAELPEVVALESVGGLAPYLAWVGQETGAPACA